MPVANCIGASDTPQKLAERMAEKKSNSSGANWLSAYHWVLWGLIECLPLSVVRIECYHWVLWGLIECYHWVLWGLIECLPLSVVRIDWVLTIECCEDWLSAYHWVLWGLIECYHWVLWGLIECYHWVLWGLSATIECCEDWVLTIECCEDWVLTIECCEVVASGPERLSVDQRLQPHEISHWTDVQLTICQTEEWLELIAVKQRNG